jgi:hypothetical protein
MKKSLFALVLAFVLIFSFACAPADTAGTSGTTATTEAAQLNIAESDCIVFLSVKETEKDNYKWYYKTVTNAEDIAAIAEAVENALENAEVKPPLAEGELAKSRASFFSIRILNDGIAGGTVIVYDDGITSGADYLVDTAELISSLSEIYERIDSEEQPTA